MKVPFTPSRKARETYSAFFRTINDDLMRLGGEHRGARRIVCECSQDDCANALDITALEYDLVREHAQRFLVAPGHELASVQRIISRTRRLSVIQESSRCPAARPPLPNDRVGRDGELPLVLIVDDDATVRALCLVSLEHEGVIAVEAPDGRLALEHARIVRPDLIVTDVSMPELDGFELAEALRRDDRTQQIPLIFLTGETGAEEEARALELGALAFVRKPFEPSAFVALVTGVLARFARRNRQVGALALELA